MSKSTKHPKHFASKFHVYLTIPQAVASGANQQIQFDGVDYDLLNEYDENVTFQFTPQEAGYYFLHAHLRFSVFVAGTIYGIYLNYGAGTINQNYDTAIVGTAPMIDTCSLIYLTPNDVVDVYAYQVSGAPANLIAGTTGTFFEAFRVG